MLRHLLPNAAGPIIVYATLALPQTMLVEALLSFLGLGVQAPLASWGTLVTEGSSQIVVYPWLLVGPSAAMAVTVLALNFLGDGLRDALDSAASATAAARGPGPRAIAASLALPPVSRPRASDRSARRALWD